MWEYHREVGGRFDRLSVHIHIHICLVTVVPLVSESRKWTVLPALRLDSY